MTGKLSVFVACLAGAILLIAPSAMGIGVTGVTPSSGPAGTTVQCTVNGTFSVPINIDINGTTYQTPTFSLDNGVDPPILGKTDAASVTATSANVSFTVYSSYPAVWYTLRASQVRMVSILAFTARAALVHAYQVVPLVYSVSPAIAKGGADIELTVKGASFVDSGAGVDGSSVRWNGEPLATTFVSDAKLTAIVPAARLATSGTAEVTVMNVTAGTTSAPTAFTIDTTQPSTDAISTVSVKRNATAKLKFLITEPANQSPTAQVVIRIKATKGGKTVKTITINNAPVNVTQTATVKATFAKGAYKWYVYATDLAGNTQSNIDGAAFTVR